MKSYIKCQIQIWALLWVCKHLFTFSSYLSYKMLHGYIYPNHQTVDPSPMMKTSMTFSVQLKITGLNIGGVTCIVLFSLFQCRHFIIAKVLFVIIFLGHFSSRYNKKNISHRHGNGSWVENKYLFQRYELTTVLRSKTASDSNLSVLQRRDVLTQSAPEDFTV